MVTAKGAHYERGEPRTLSVTRTPRGPCNDCEDSHAECAAAGVECFRPVIDAVVDQRYDAHLRTSSPRVNREMP